MKKTLIYFPNTSFPFLEIKIWYKTHHVNNNVASKIDLILNGSRIDGIIIINDSDFISKLSEFEIKSISKYDEFNQYCSDDELTQLKELGYK